MPNFPIPESNQPRKTRRKPAPSVQPVQLRNTQTTCYALPKEEVRMGRCDICDDPRELRFRDASSGQQVGFCCVADLVFADQAIASADQMSGLRRPTLAEAKQLTR